MTDTRTEPPHQGDERTILTSFLDYHRDTLMWKCEGLTESQLRERAVPPSSLSLLGLVRHLTEVERSWFRRVLIDEDAPPIYYTDADPDGDFDHLDSTPVDEVFAAWRAEVDRAREIVAEADSLETVAKEGRREPPVNLRWILAHLIEEYARHNGHADLIRERIDGQTGE